MIAIDYHGDLKELLGAPALAYLCGPATQTAPFDRIGWWQALAGHCGLTPMIAVAREGDEAAILPLMAGANRLEALANYYNFRWRPLLTPGGGHLLAALARDLASRAGRITLAPLPDEDGSAARLAHGFAEAGWVVERMVCDTNHYLEVGGRDFATYLATRPGALRSTLARKAGQVDCAVHTALTDALWEDYTAIYAESWKPAEASFAFWRAFAEAESAAGRLRLGIVSHDGEAVAAQLWSIEGGCAFIHKLAYRTSAKPLSPGTALTAAMMRQVIDVDRVAMVDYGTGDEPYKRDWMEAARPRYRLDLFNPGSLRHWPHIARARFRRLGGATAAGQG